MGVHQRIILIGDLVAGFAIGLSSFIPAAGATALRLVLNAQLNPEVLPSTWSNKLSSVAYLIILPKIIQDNKLFFRGARIFKAIMDDLLRQGMQHAQNAILTGSSAGGLATILSCDKFKSLLPIDARVKCVADAGFFINGKTISGNSNVEDIYDRVVTLHGSAKNLPPYCTSIMEPSLCFFPQNVVPYMQTPLFIINSAYDSYQINNTLVPDYLDPQHVWEYCKVSINNCTFSQRIIIQELLEWISWRYSRD